MSSASLAIALGEYDIGWEDPAASLTRAEQLAARASDAGARLIAFPEMCTTGFTMDPERWAEPLDGPSVTRLRTIASERGLWVAAGVSTREQLERDEAPRGYNSHLLVSPAGEIVAHYRKRRLFAYGGEREVYAPGETSAVVDVEGVRVALYVCYELRFPELFRTRARETDVMLLIANWPAARRAHWDALLRARAIENLAHMIGVNRTGDAGGLAYDGGSAAYGPWGDRMDDGRGTAADSTPAIVTVHASEVQRVREKYPFLDELASVDEVAHA